MAAGHSDLTNTAKPYPYQVAGHSAQGRFQLTEDGCVLKPVQRPPKGMREVVFYDTVFNKKEKRDEMLQLRVLLPHYYGVVQMNTSQYLKLENITHNFHVPCVMDIKIGKVTWDDDADETLRERRRMKWPLREITGFSILGFMVYNHQKCCYEHYNQDWCRKLSTAKDAEQCFHRFLEGVQFQTTYSVLEKLIRQLVDIKKWFTTQRLYRFIASSILIVYEGNSPQKPERHFEQPYEQTGEVEKNLLQLHQKNTLVDTRIIDTAHVYPSTDIDGNYLFGLENVISILERCREIYTVK